MSGISVFSTVYRPMPHFRGYRRDTEVNDLKRAKDALLAFSTEQNDDMMLRDANTGLKGILISSLPAYKDKVEFVVEEPGSITNIKIGIYKFNLAGPVIQMHARPGDALGTENSSLSDSEQELVLAIERAIQQIQN